MASQLQNVFNGYAKDGDMDSRTLVKICKEAGLIGGNFSSTQIDLIFSSVKQKGSQRISFPEFENALHQIAEKKKMSADKVIDIIQSLSSGPQYSGTKAQPNRFHDDKSLYSGVHAHGGPSTIDDRIDNLSKLTDRTASTVRGTKM